LNSTTDHVATLLGAALGSEFRVLRLIGEGTVARVYLAGETALERLVAVKVLKPEFGEDDVAIKRFLREARAAARIHHSNIPVIHRVGQLENDLPYLIMEHIDGRTLADTLAADANVSVERSRAVLTQLASALAAAHAQRVIHRDVKPANILMERASDRAVLMDFGLAGIVESGTEQVTRLTKAGQLLGDPRYLSPERILGEPAVPESDVYSLAIVIYEMLTGAGPFGKRASAAETVTAHLNASAIPLSRLRADAPADLSALLLRCLARKPQQRPSADEVVRALSGAQISTTVAEPPVFPVLQSFLAELKRRRVYRTAVAYLAAAFVLLQGIDLVMPALRMEAWLYKALVTLILGAFPVVIVLTWAFDVTRSGIEHTADVPAGDALARSPLKRALFIGGGIAVSVAIAGLLGWWLLS
jgi:eukaryotic-like serine/threonine-protein kinase